MVVVIVPVFAISFVIKFCSCIVMDCKQYTHNYTTKP